VIAAGRLDDRLIADAIARVPDGRLARWIDEGDAADIECDGEAAVIRASLEALSGVDLAVRPGPIADPRVFVADMDSTMIGQECIDELADYAGVKDEVAAVTERAMQGELDFKEALAARVALLEGLGRAALEECRTRRIRPNPGAGTLVATLNAAGVRTALVSGGFTDFVKPIGALLGFREVRANVLGFDGDTLTGATSGPVIDGTAKRDFALSLLAEDRLEPESLVAIGDGANDSLMVGLAGLGIGYRPKPALDGVANAAIRHHDLSAVLWMLGIPKARWTIVPEPGNTPAA
jgi:phosphoserine phosphatase